jgi:hypothetical protein
VETACSWTVVACALTCTACFSSLDKLTSKGEDVSTTNPITTSPITTGTSTPESTVTCSATDCTTTGEDAGRPEEDAATIVVTPDADAPPNVACGPGTYVVLEQGSVTCRACADGEYSTTTGATECKPWTDCVPGQFVSTQGSTLRDRTCTPCPAQETSESSNAESCSPVSCTAGTEKDESGECVACQAGTYCVGGSEPSLPCDDHSWDDDGAPATACVPRRTCGEGERVGEEGNATANRTCVPCETGTFNTTDNASTCMEFSQCSAGTYVSVMGTSGNDYECTECEPGSFSSTDNAPECTPWTECEAPANRMSSGPTSLIDRRCVACTSPNVTRENNETACGLHAYLTSFGEVSIEAEHYFAAQGRGDTSWILVEDANRSGGAYLLLGPEAGASWTADPVTTAPQLHFRVNFADGGVYFLHVRGDANAESSAGSDSCYAGIDGATPQYTFEDVSGTWGWRSQTFTITSAGLHTISVYGREDGFRIDKIVVNTAASAPSGNGPNESVYDESLQTD